MPTKLKFKGDKGKKKRRHEDDDGTAVKRKRHDAEDEDDSAWVRPEKVEEIRGPVFILHPSDPTPLCVAFDATRGKVTLSSLDKTSKPEPEAGEEDGGEDEPRDQTQTQTAPVSVSVMDRTPTDVSQVWVSTRVAGSDTLSLRSGVASSTGSGETKFLSCDRHGLVSADREARGPEESWTPTFLPDGMVAFQSVYENYLGLDEVAGGAKALRGDAGEVGFHERFWVKVQARYKREAGEEERKKKEGEKKLKVDEAGTKYVLVIGLLTLLACGSDILAAMCIRHGVRVDLLCHRGISARSALLYTTLEGRYLLYHQLYNARKEGNLSEALLDRRSKLKR